MTRVATGIYDLHPIMMGIILVTFVGVFGVMFYSIYAYRKSVKAEHFHQNITVEFIWTIIPFLILIAGAWPATKAILNFKDTASPDIRIKARQLPDRELRGLDGNPFRLSQLRGKWVILQIDSGSCGEACRRNLLYLRQMRLAQGKEMSRIERVWLLTDDAAPEPALLREFGGTYVVGTARGAMLAEFSSGQDASGHIYVIDPLGNLILRFPKNPDPAQMVKDLARLLRGSRIG